MPYQKYSSGFLNKRASILCQIRDPNQRADVDLVLTALELLRQNCATQDLPMLSSVLDMTVDAAAMDVERWPQLDVEAANNVVELKFATAAE